MTGTRRGVGKLLYRQIEQELLRRIRANELTPGQRLPTEPDLAAEWGVNRLTIRQAIGELARAGHVNVRQGSGTYVADRQVVVEFDLSVTPSADAGSGNDASATKHIQPGQAETLVRLMTDDTDSAVKALENPGPFVRIDTLMRTSDEQPFAVCSYWIEAARVPGYTPRTGERIGLLHDLRKHGLDLRHSWRSLSATVATWDDAQLLDIPAGSPVMLREGVNVDGSLAPTMYLRRRVRGDRIRYTMQYDTTSHYSGSKPSGPITGIDFDRSAD